MIKKIQNLRNILEQIKRYQPNSINGIGVRRELFKTLPSFLVDVEKQLALHVELAKLQDAALLESERVRIEEQTTVVNVSKGGETPAALPEPDPVPEQPKEEGSAPPKNNEKETTKKVAKKSTKKAVKSDSSNISKKSQKNNNGGSTKKARKVVASKHGGSVGDKPNKGK